MLPPWSPLTSRAMRGPKSERHVTRNFAVGNFEFVVSTTTPADCELIEAVFQDVPAPESPQREPALFSLTRQGSECEFSGLRLHRQRTSSIENALTLLVAEVNVSAL